MGQNDYIGDNLARIAGEIVTALTPVSGQVSSSGNNTLVTPTIVND